MQKRHGQVRPEMKCTFPFLHEASLNIEHSFLGLEMDVRNLTFQADSFDVAIDKGTMDAMMTAKGDVWVCPK